MQQAEAAIRLAAKTLLMLDTVMGDTAERLYTRLGWNRVALYPDGTLCDTIVFWKRVD